jgi:hypothetical protein
MTIPESHSAPPGELLTVPEVMALMHVSKCRIYDLIMSDELRSVAIGRKSDGRASSRRVSRQAVTDLVAKWERDSAEELAVRVMSQTAPALHDGAHGREKTVHRFGTGTEAQLGCTSRPGERYLVAEMIYTGSKDIADFHWSRRFARQRSGISH